MTTILTASQFQALYNKAPDKVAFLKQAESEGRTVIPSQELGSVTALYHSNKGRQFRPSKREMESEKYSCPYCQGTLKKITIRPRQHVLSCGKCRWSIHPDDLWKPTEKEVPNVREPGDATGPEHQPELDGQSEPEIDIAMSDAIQLEPQLLVVT
jgi:ribosomal protein L37AE/L43A